MAADKKNKPSEAEATDVVEEKGPLPPVILKILGVLKKVGAGIKNLVVGLMIAIRDFFTEPGSVWMELPHLLRATRSEDAPTRRMSWVFIGSLSTFFLIVAALVGKHFYAELVLKKKFAQLQLESTAEQRRQERELDRLQLGMVVLGKFVVQLKGDVPFKPRGGPHALNLAEVDVVVYCDSAKTQAFVNKHLVEAKNEVADVFTALDRKDSMSAKGKLHLAHLILVRLNHWLPEGKVEQVYFSRFALG